MALLTVAARRASVLLRPKAAAARFSSIRRRSYSSSTSSIRSLRAEAASCRAEAASYRAEAVSFRAKADSLRAATHDGELLGVIDSAMHSYNGNLAEEIPSEFPFVISKIEELTRTDVTLTRCLKGEKIEVLVSMPRLASDEDDDLQESSNSSSSSSDETSSSSDNETSSSSDDSSWYSDETSSSSDSETSSSDKSSSSSEDEAKNRTEEYNLPIRKKIEHSLPLMVTVSKPDGSSMKFACDAYHDEITIDTVSVRQRPSGAEEGDNNAYDDGPDFSDLDNNLQEGLHKYLEVRGVTPNNIELLHKYIISKEWQHYQVWLAKLRHFVRKN
ncbi:uncharacterized protein At2g39795, mitochondrial-like [Triticum aestivum]|uniref:uncharacterized protein At2g39795, mitochondrial-like n=1 Tax=Triticum aestivum TaxID=4565 RepID=UPI001D010DFE|nr:uncharacterized protein At2g39795, mitochondrial-like [Triticum aestivum]